MPVPRVKYFLQCDAVQNQGNKFSAIGIFDTIYSLIFPANHKQFFILLGFVGSEGEYEVEVQFRAPDGGEIARAQGRLVLNDPEHVANVIFGFENFPLPQKGQYTITTFLDGDYLVEHAFRVQSPAPPRERTREEIEMLMAQPDIIKSANVDISCDQCKAVYRFQHSLDPESQPEQGFLRLPPGELFACAVCGRHIDIQQVRENLEGLVGIPRQWLQPPSPPAQT